MKGNRYIFADERIKKKLLDIVLDIQLAESWSIYAFCITDDRAYFMIEAVDHASVKNGMRKVADLFFKLYGNSAWIPYSTRRTDLSTGSEKELRSLQDIAVCCRQIHRIPVEKGYVNRIHDYWWSSYNTYIGNYVWKMVDCRIVLLYFSLDPETARRRLQQYHQG
jgi:REP element-mobilizing transposase RayT